MPRNVMLLIGLLTCAIGPALVLVVLGCVAGALVCMVIITILNPKLNPKPSLFSLPPFPLTFVFISLLLACVACALLCMVFIFPSVFLILFSFFLFPSFLPSVSSPYFAFPQFHFLLACTLGVLLCMVLILSPFPRFFLFPLSWMRWGHTLCMMFIFFFLVFPPSDFLLGCVGGIRECTVLLFCFGVLIGVLIVFVLCSH